PRWHTNAGLGADQSISAPELALARPRRAPTIVQTAPDAVAKTGMILREVRRGEGSASSRSDPRSPLLRRPGGPAYRGRQVPRLLRSAGCAGERVSGRHQAGLPAAGPQAPS